MGLGLVNSIYFKRIKSRYIFWYLFAKHTKKKFNQIISTEGFFEINVKDLVFFRKMQRKNNYREIFSNYPNNSHKYNLIYIYK